ncbi:hypothetical protein LOF13_20630 [Klebsiella pneumoniae subsp. pneumoniae]|nr:hypothetical protein LOF13_20630 [Klebsiella pneumoniae subsp. pneumoniae]
MLSLALLVVLGMLYFVLPEFTAIYQTFSTPLPLLTRMVVAAGDMLSRGWPLLLASLLSPLLLNQLIRRRSDWLLRRQRLLNAPSHWLPDRRTTAEPDLHHPGVNPKRRY